MAANDSIFQALRGADVSDNDLSGMKSDAHFHVGQTVEPVLLIDGGHRQLHFDRARRGALGVIVVPVGSAKKDKDCVTDELIDCAAVLFHDRHHARQIAIKNADDPFRIHALG